MTKVEKQRCKVCGCTDEQACIGGCSWVKWNLCSACADATPTGYKAKPLHLYDVYRCKTPMAKHPGKFHVSHVAVLLNSRWEPVELVPGHADRKLGRFLSKGKTEAILEAKGRQ